MSGWNDGGRGEGGNRRMFNPREDLMSNDGMEVFSSLELGFNPIKMQKETRKDDGGMARVGRSGREMNFRVIGNLAS